MRSKEEIEALKIVREKLKECKPEWLEKNAKNQLSLGVLTVIQILDYATDCVTSWDFVPEEQWREEITKYDKSINQYVFDGYVYHVKGTLTIEGLGQRSQYGSKIAIGGKDNQNSSYKSAASDCLKKCASLFGVGQSVYSKIKIDTEEEWNQPVAQAQPAVAAVPEQVVLPNGDVQQGEYIWSQNAQQWIHLSKYQSGNGGHYPPSGLTEEEQKRQWYHDTMQAYDPNAYQQMRQEVGPSPFELANEPAGEIDYPFENVEATPTNATFEATPQGEAVPQAFEAVAQETNVAPVSPWEVNQPAETVVSENHPWDEKGTSSKQEDPLAHIVANNPWNEPGTMQEMQVFAAHKERLQIQNNQQLLPHIRDYFKDATATLAHITPEILKGFNAYLQHIHA